MCELEIELTDEECISWGKENYERMLRRAKYNRPLSRIVAAKPNPTDYWKSAFAKLMAEMGTK
jgi:hypothetical protein